MEKKERRQLGMGKWEPVYWAAAMIPFAISLVFYQKLPEQVPTQWGWEGQVRGYSGRFMACFGIPAFMLVMELLIAAAFRLDPKWKNIRRSGVLGQLSRWFLVVLRILVQAVITAAGLGQPVDVSRIVSMFIGFAILVMGNYLPRCRYNFTMGIRTPWTLNDEKNWNKTHRIAGFFWTAGGILMVVLGYFRMAVLYFAVLAVIVLVPVGYSYVLYRRESVGRRGRRGRLIYPILLNIKKIISWK